MFGTHGTTSTSCNCSSILGALDPFSLELHCHHFLTQDLASSTCSAYLSGQKKFYDVCLQLGKVHQSGFPCPTDEWKLCLFATLLANTVQQSTSKVYLSAVARCILSKALQILWLTACGYNDYLEESRERKVIPPRYAFQLLMASCMMVIFCTLDLSLHVLGSL